MFFVLCSNINNINNISNISNISNIEYCYYTIIVLSQYGIIGVVILLFVILRSVHFLSSQVHFLYSVRDIIS